MNDGKSADKNFSALLIGDSISLSYRELVKFILRDTMKIFYPPENGRFVAYTFRALYEWSRDLKWSSDTQIVYWNNGLWDVVRIFGDEPQTPLNDYGILIERTFNRLKYLFPQAKIIFATSTPVLEGRFDRKIFYRSNADIEKYNDVAREIILRNGGLVHDLYAITKNFPLQAYQDATHFIPKACEFLALNVANVLNEVKNNSVKNF
ncbi:MAG: SGNH/GDSL hydrolase family protein [Selenomonadaceae bacterium]|nr:SGNH/GDSL hydrolase family protein [Selenomonadaceae bacterium]